MADKCCKDTLLPNTQRGRPRCYASHRAASTIHSLTHGAHMEPGREGGKKNSMWHLHRLGGLPPAASHGQHTLAQGEP